MPYAPGQQYDFSPLAQGIAQFGQNIRNFAQKTKEDSQKSASLRKVMALYNPDRKDEFNAMGLKDLEAESAAQAAKRQMEQDQMQRQLQQSQMANQSANNTRADQYLGLNLKQFERSGRNEDQRRADDEALKGAVQMFARDWAQGPPQALSPDSLSRYEGPQGNFKYAAEQNPIALMHPAIQALFHYMPKQDEQTMKPEFSEDPETGARFFMMGKQALPSGTNPKRIANTKAMAIEDAEGNPIPGVHAVVGPRGNVTVVKTQEPKIKTGTGILNDQVGFTGTPAQYKAWMESNGQSNTPPSATKTDGKSATVVMTNPDGRRVNVPADRVEEAKKAGYK